MPQNTIALTGRIRRGIVAPAVVKGAPGTVLSVLCWSAGTLDLINDTAANGAGASLAGFPATMVKAQVLPLGSTAPVGIAAKAVSGEFDVSFR
jgi:hypothetical protein